MVKEAGSFISYLLEKGEISKADRKRLEAAQRELNGTPITQEQSVAESKELDLQAEWERQANLFIERDFHKILKIAKGKYKDSLPRFTPQPEAYRGRFDTPILIEGRIPAPRQYELAGVKYFLGGLNVRDWEDDPQGFKTPDVPYTTWMQDGGVNFNKSVRKVRKNLAEDERGGTLLDGAGFYIARPEVLKDHYIDLPGTSVGAVYAPSLYLWDGGPRVDDGRVDVAGPGFGSLSAGRQLGFKS